jgi:uncharacterized protein YpmS
MPRGPSIARSFILSSIVNRSSHTIVFIAFCSLWFASLACQIDIGGPERPGELIQSDESQATEVVQTWSQAIIDAASVGQVNLLFNETQMTGFVTQRLEADSDPVIKDPQIYLRQGQIQVFGIFEQGILKSTALIRIEPSIDDVGQLSLQVVEVSVGPIPAPALLMESISAVLTEALTGSFGSLATGIKITSVVISEGEMAIVGEIR